MMLSVALLIIITSLFTGFIHLFEDHSQRFWGQVIVGIDIPSTDYKTLIDTLEQNPAIETARPHMTHGGLLYLGEGKARGVQLVGIDLSRRARDDYFRAGLLLQSQVQGVPTFNLSDDAKTKSRAWLQKKMERIGRTGQTIDDKDLPIGAIVGIGVLGQPDDLTDEYDKAAIARELADRTDPMVITLGKSGDKASDSAPEKLKRTCWPVDVVQIGQHHYDSATVYLPIEYLMELTGTVDGDGVLRSGVQVQITGKPGYATEDVIAATRAGLGVFGRTVLKWPDHIIASIPVVASLEIGPVRDLTREFNKQLVILQVIVGFICLVVALLIFVILLMIVMQKQRDIGIIRALGCSRWGVAWIFLGYGACIGLVGSGLGVGLGIWATWHINGIEGFLSQLLGFKIWKSGVYMFSQIPDRVDVSSLLWIVIVGIVTATLGAFLPAVRAARLQPVVTLRHE
ncbi:MAG: FtsX-like permease family protein [Phycisphaerae bacterium]|nr:FtsX-like permease family protein [Phycisphaerae bacterium]